MPRSPLSSGPGFVDDLKLGKFRQPLLGKLRADPGLFGAAERNVRGHIEMLVDPDGTRLDLARDLVRPLRIRRPDRRAKPVGGGVGAADRVIVVGILDDRQYRPELLLVDQLRAFLNFAHDGRLDKISGPVHRLATRVYSEYAWHSLFIQNLLIEPKAEELENFLPQFTIIDLPSFEADPEKYGVRTGTVIACNFAKRIVLIGGTSYAGEIKKSVFSMLNYDLPGKRVMPMHCSANVGPAGDTAIFFGLSGTGKTTLSAVATRTLIGDDEHGWSESGVFNFEGGCYAKMIKLSA